MTRNIADARVAAFDQIMSRPAPTADAFLIGYHGDRLGVLVDHLDRALAVPGARLAAGRLPWIVFDGIAHPIWCGEIVEAWGEDGPYTTRCAARVEDTDEGAACPAHAEQIAAWRAQSPAEVIAWEHELDMLGR